MAAMKEDNGSLKMYLGEMKELRKPEDNQDVWDFRSLRERDGRGKSSAAVRHIVTEGPIRC